MDTSETYIKISRKAYNFLPKHKWQDGDYGFYDGRVVVFCEECHTCQSDIFDGTWIPLLRQDQLQEMICKDAGLQSICWLSYEYSTGRCSGITINGTMEQLWLGIVMSEKYNKVWNGEDWVS